MREKECERASERAIDYALFEIRWGLYLFFFFRRLIFDKLQEEKKCCGYDWQPKALDLIDGCRFDLMAYFIIML